MSRRIDQKSFHIAKPRLSNNGLQFQTSYLNMSEQKAILLREVGKPVELGSRPVPTPASEQVKIKVTSTMREL